MKTYMKIIFLSIISRKMLSLLVYSEKGMQKTCAIRQNTQEYNWMR